MKKLCFMSLALLLITMNAIATKHVITASGTQLQFIPNNIPNVMVGDTIRWVWGSGSHTTTSLTIPGGAATWDHPLNSSNQSFEYPVTMAGTYNYKCTPHFSMGMTGTFTASQLSVNPCDTIICDDGDACTVDDCDSLSGCIFFPINCDDGDDCTVDACISGVCVNTPVLCDDGDLCTDDFCDPLLGCFNIPISCDDGDACTDDACDPLTGCITTPIVCDDGDNCTTDGCDPAWGCTSTPIVCDDGDQCTADDCTNGVCSFTPIICDDGDICTNDACIGGVCTFSVIPGCINPCDTIVCDDLDACTTDACINGNCVFTPIVCDDNDACTTDNCVPSTGCSATAIFCDDGDPCTSDGCNPLTGCTTTPVSCDDGDPCTADGCDPLSGCTSTWTADSTYANITSCNPADTGVVISSFTNQFGCDSFHIVTTSLLECDDSDACTTDSCGNRSCVFTLMNCDDENDCTSDACANGQCSHTPVNCNDSDACTTDGCINPSGCTNIPIVCDDGDSCTTDGCDPLTGCTATPISGCNVGIEDVSSISDNINAYPNPVQDVLTIEGAYLTIRKVVIKDALGKLVFDSGRLNASSQLIEIRNLLSGFYILQVETDKGMAAKKLLIQE